MMEVIARHRKGPALGARGANQPTPVTVDARRDRPRPIGYAPRMARLPHRFAALVTAAGASSRMGSPKALARWGDVPLLLHQARVLERCPGLGAIVAVLGADADRIRGEAASWTGVADLRLVDNPRWEEGRSASFEVGVAALGAVAGDRAGGLFVAAIDQPLDPAVIDALVAASGPGDEVLLPTHGGRRGHPVLLPWSLVPELGRASAYPEGLRDIVRAAQVREVPVASPSIHLDLNTPAALAAARRARFTPDDG